MNDKFKGLIYGAVAAATYGMNPLFALPLYKEGLTADSVLFYRYALAVAMLGITMLIRKIPFAVSGKMLLLLLGGGLLTGLSSLFLFLSYNYMGAGIASTILFVYPVMVAVIMAVCFHEKVTPVTIFSIVLALTGIALLYKGEDGATLSTKGVVFVLLSALTYAVYMVAVKQTKLREVPGMPLTFYVLLFGVPVFFLRLRCGIDLQTIPSWFAFGNVVMLALLPTYLSFLFIALAVRYVGPTPTAILGALEPATAVFFSVLLFGEPLTLRLCIGILLIISAVTLIILGKPLAERLAKLRR